MSFSNIAQLAHAEYLSAKPDETVAFFKDLLGMQETHREGQSVYLRGYQDTYHHSLIITESDDAGLGHVGWRAESPEALERVVTDIEATGLGRGWEEDHIGHGRAFCFETPDGHKQEVFWDVERYQAPPELASKMACAPQRRPLQGVPVRRIDHINLMAADIGATSEFFRDTLGFKIRERIEMPDASELGNWFSVSVLPHELAVMSDMTGTRGRLHHIAFWYGVDQHLADLAETLREHDIEIEAGPSKHGVTQSSFMYVYEPGGNRVELFGTYGYLVLDPDAETKTWTEESLPIGGSVYGLSLPDSFFAYGTPNVEITEDALSSVFVHAPAAMPMS